jgi:hypothetical protein
MAKIERSEAVEFKVLPNGIYHWTLIGIREKDLNTKFGVRPSFIWVLKPDLYQKIEVVKGEKKGEPDTKKRVWAPIPSDDYQAVKITGKKFHPQAELNKWIAQLCPGYEDDFMNLSGDTDSFVGWQGTGPSMLVTQGDKKFVNLGIVTPDKEWLESWVDSGMPGNNELLNKWRQQELKRGTDTVPDLDDLDDPFA